MTYFSEDSDEGDTDQDLEWEQECGNLNNTFDWTAVCIACVTSS